MDIDLTIVLDIIVPLSIGVVIGTERGWSQRKEEEGTRVAGLRTFALTGLLGGLSAILAESLTLWFLPAAFLSMALLFTVSHFLKTKSNQDFGITSEIALFLTFALAAWSVFDQKIAAISVAVVVTAILSLKAELHRWLNILSIQEIYAGIKLLLISVVLLPLLPDKGYGPYEALNPYWIWWMVVLISGLSFMGFIAMKYWGARAGAFATAIIGSLASSTAVTISLAKLAKRKASKELMINAALLAAVVMFVRMAIEVSVVHAPLLHQLWLPMGGMVAVILVGGGILYYRTRSKKTEHELEVKNPLQLKTALQFGVLLAAILLLSEFLSDRFGDGGIIALSIVAGLADVDAITISLSEMGKSQIDENLAALGIVLASVSNTLVKGGIFTFYVGFKSSFRFILILIVAGILGIVLALFNTNSF